DLAAARYNNDTGAAFVRELAQRVRSLPGVQQSTIAAITPNNSGIFIRLRKPGADPGPDSMPRFGMNVVEPGYFSTMKIPIIAGRDFNSGDRENSQPVAIVSEKAVREFWPGQNPLGQRLPLEGGDPGGLNTSGAVVVGVVGDVRSLNGPIGARPLLY